MAVVLWTGRARRSLDAIFDRIAEESPTGARNVQDFMIRLADSLDVFSAARGRRVAGTDLFEILDQKWKRYAVRFVIEPNGVVLIVDIRRIRPFPPRSA